MPPIGGGSPNDAPRVFVDCQPSSLCDQEFVRTEIGWVDHVRDRAVPDAHVLVTRQSTGGGGAEYTLAFLGQRRFAGVSDTLRYRRQLASAYRYFASAGLGYTFGSIYNNVVNPRFGGSGGGGGVFFGF